MNCDHSYAAKVMGNKAAGCKEGRCPLCTIDFSALSANKLWRIESMKMNIKSFLIYWIVSHDPNFKDYKSIATIFPGFKKFPPLIECWLELEKKNLISYEEGYQWLQFYQLGFDNLHNCKGFLISFLNMLKESNEIRFKIKLFKKLIFDYMGKNDINSFSGTQYRILSIYFREIILPCIDTNSEKKLIIEKVFLINY